MRKRENWIDIRKLRNKFTYANEEGLRINTDGTTIKDRKPDIKLKPNHYWHIPKVRRTE